MNNQQENQIKLSSPPKRSTPQQPGDKPPADARRKLGAAGEEIAVRTLRAAGVTVIERNWRCSAGEIDVVGEELAHDFVSGMDAVPWRVFVEVRTRRGKTFGTALQSITGRKAAKLREVAAHYVQATNWRGPWRIDVVAVQMDASGRLLQVEHIRHAVAGE